MSISREEMKKRVADKGYKPKKVTNFRKTVKVWEDKSITPEKKGEVDSHTEKLSNYSPSEDKTKSNFKGPSRQLSNNTNPKMAASLQKLLERELTILAGVQKNILEAIYKKSLEQGDNESIFVRQNELSLLANVAQGSVKNSINRLIKKGLIEKEGSILSHGGGYILKINSYVYEKISAGSQIMDK